MLGMHARANLSILSAGPEEMGSLLIPFLSAALVEKTILIDVPVLEKNDKK